MAHALKFFSVDARSLGLISPVVERLSTVYNPKTLEIHPDLIISDLAMPKMDGYDMVKKIREAQNGKAIPIIGISASDPADVRASAFQRLCDDYLEKPFYQRDVLEKVSSLLALNRPPT